MLTWTDIHYLVGLLTRVTIAEDVEIELGEMVFDKAANKWRDVDITVKHKNVDGTITAFRGIEVKDHLRPLTVENIEQLCMKFNDMPEVTHKAIVSASGYTKSAIKKAQSHNVELFKLMPWEDPSNGFNQVFAPVNDELLSEITYNWIQSPNIAINVPDNYRALLNGANWYDLKVCTQDGSPIPAFCTGEDLRLYIANHAAKEHTKSLAGTLKSKITDSIVKRIIEPTDSIFIDHQNTIVPIIDFRILGILRYISIIRKTIYKILIRQNETKPYVGCAITEMGNGNLIGFTVNNETNKMDFIQISLTDRQKKKISQRKI